MGTHMSIMHCYAKHFFPSLSICSTLGFTRINKISGWNWFSWSWHMNTDWPWQRLGKKEVILPKKPICLETFRSNKRQKGSSSNCVDYPNNTIEGFLFLIFFKYWTCNSTNPKLEGFLSMYLNKTLQVTKKLQVQWLICGILSLKSLGFLNWVYFGSSAEFFFFLLCCFGMLVNW